jgi:hypothetical protein
VKSEKVEQWNSIVRIVELSNFPVTAHYFQASYRQSVLLITKKSIIMEGSFVAIMFFLTFFGAIFGVMYFYYTTRNRERLAIIEKNADPSILRIEPTNVFKKFSIKLGMLFIGGGLGVLVGNILTVATRLEEPVAYLSMIFVFAGAGLILSYFVARKVD